MSLLRLDFETRSREPLKKVGAYRYAASDDFRLLLMSYAVDDEPVKDIEGQEEILDTLSPYLSDQDVTFVAHNANFERVTLSAALGMGAGKYLDPRRFECTQILAREHGLPASLLGLARVVGGEQKDEAGSALIRFFCVPRRDGTYNQPEDHPEKWAQFVAYCHQDTETLIDVHEYLLSLGGWPTEIEREAWYADQAINDRGIAIDLDVAKAAKAAAELNAIDHRARIRELTGIANPGSQPQMMRWVADNAIDGIFNMRKDDIEAALDDPELEFTEEQREVLELRLELAMASSKKYASAINAVLPDGRLRGTLQFYGAHTARWAGRGTQVQNLPSASFTRVNAAGKTVYDPVTEALTIMDLLAGERISPLDLKRLVRPLFWVNGVSVDYSAIEARVIAMLAGEEWVLQAFRENRDLYVETAKRMSTPRRKLERKHGKIAVLALGFGGGINSLKAFGADGDDDELRLLVSQWRRANPKIVRLWADLAEAFSEGGKVGQFLRVTHSNDRMGRTAHLHLPSGRAINYHGIKWEVYTVKDKKTGRRKRKEGWRFWDPKFPFNRNARIGTYGGRLTENAVQAVARDLLARALVRLEQEGFETIAHIHDEILVADAVVEEVAKIMTEPVDWFPGFPNTAEGEVMERFRK